MAAEVGVKNFTLDATFDLPQLFPTSATTYTTFFFLHGYTADGGCRVRRRVRKLKNKGRDLTLQISDYVILMSLDTFLILFSSYHPYFCSCRPSKKVVQMWKSWVCFNFFKFSKNSPLKNQEKKNFLTSKKFFHFLCIVEISIWEHLKIVLEH